MTDDRMSAREYTGSLSWGTHLCQFHSTNDELTETLVPYFAAGLQQDEFCVWVTSDPTGVEGARIGLRKAAPYLDQYFDRGQIEIWDSRDWYLRGGHFDADRVFGQWVEKETRLVDSGYKGCRASGDMAWLQKRDWPDFMTYEAEVNRVFPQHRMIGLCTYPLDGLTPDAVFEVVRNHQFAMARIAGEWEIIESSSARTASGNSQRLSAEVLEQRDEERRWIATQLHEMTAQNVSAIRIYIAGLQQRKSLPSAVKFILTKCQSLSGQTLEHILTLSHLLHPLILDELGLAVCLRRYVEGFVKRSRIRVELETGPEVGRLPLEIETHLFRVVQEGLSNVLSHSGSPNAIVRLHRQDDQVILQIEDFGRGMPGTTTAAVSRSAGKGGLGIFAMRQRLRKIGGRLEIRSSEHGTLLTATIRLSKKSG